MRLVMIGVPRTPYTLQTAVREAMECGYHVYLADTHENLQMAFSILKPDEFVPIISDLSDVGSLVANIRPLHAEMVIAITEFSLCLAADVREQLGLPGVPFDVEESVRDKFRTREILAKSGLTKLSFKLANEQTLETALQEVGLPAIVKPRSLTGSIGVKLINSISEIPDLVYTYQQNKMIGKTEFLVEEFCTGPELSAEGIVVNGKLHLLALTDKRTSEAPYFIETGHTIPSKYTTLYNEQIADYLQKVVNVLKLEMCPVHAEFRLTTRGPELIELHTRFGGDYITRLVYEAYGYSAFKIYYLAAQFKEMLQIDSPHPLVASIEFFTCPAGLLKEMYLPSSLSTHPGVRDFKMTKQIGDVIRGEITPLERVGHILACLPSHEDMDQFLNEVQQQLIIHVEQENTIARG